VQPAVRERGIAAGGRGFEYGNVGAGEQVQVRLTANLSRGTRANVVVVGGDVRRGLDFFGVL
jgi:hypothetical protein